MAEIVSNIGGFVTDMAGNAIQSVSNALTKRKIALITGITGQVIIMNKIQPFHIFYFLGWKLFD
jgi:hypothetical protein